MSKAADEFRKAADLGLDGMSIREARVRENLPILIAGYLYVSGTEFGSEQARLLYDLKKRKFLEPILSGTNYAVMRRKRWIARRACRRIGDLMRPSQPSLFVILKRIQLRNLLTVINKAELGVNPSQLANSFRLSPIVTAINTVVASNSAVAFDESLKRLDQVVGSLFGMSQEHLEYIISAMTT